MWLIRGSRGGYLVSYDIDGSISEKRASQASYFADVAKRYVLTYLCEQIDSEPFTDALIDNERRYDLRQIAKNLKSLKRRANTFHESKRVYSSADDQLFWIAKEYCEITLKKGLDIDEFQIRQVILRAGGTYAEAKAKAKSIYRWYKERNFKTSSRTHEMSRAENARKQAKNKANKAKASVLSAYTSMSFLNEKTTAIAIAENANVTRKTASKYLKELKADGLI